MYVNNTKKVYINKIIFISKKKIITFLWYIVIIVLF